MRDFGLSSAGLLFILQSGVSLFVHGVGEGLPLGFFGFQKGDRLVGCVFGLE